MKSSKIGGQAVIEGVMMKNADRYAVAVRKPDGEIIVDVQNAGKDRKAINKIPVVRGVFAFIDSMVIGIKTLTFSASFFDEEEPKQDEDDSSKKNNKKADKEEKNPEKKDVQETALIGGTVALSIVLAIGLFVLLPLGLSKLLLLIPNIPSWVVNVCEGIFRILIFLGYIILISRLEDIKRVFMYHGAEHKSINCVEHGLDLTVENVRTQSRQHKRCGTSFLFFVVFISVIVFIFIDVDKVWLQAIIRLLLVPVIAGVSYEIIRFAGNSDNKIVAAISKPGFMLQNLTTREPDDSMIEVAIASVEAVFDWKSFVEQVRAEADQQMISEKVPTGDEDIEDNDIDETSDDTTEIDDIEVDDIEVDDIDDAAEAERIAKEEAAKMAAEAERIAKEEAAAKKAAEKAEKEAKKAAEKAEKEARKAAEKAEKEAQKEAARLAAEAEAAAKAEAERVAKEAAEAAAKAEAERVAKEAAEAAAKAEAERKAQEEAEAKAQEESNIRKSKDLSSLDKVLFVKKEQPAREFKDPLATRKVKAELRDTDEEEDDDVLKALDKFFVFKDSND